MTTFDNPFNAVHKKTGFGEHNLLVYPDIDTFREIYCMYARMHLEPKHNEILLLVTQDEPIDSIRENLRNFGVDADRHEKNGSLIIVDSVKGYQLGKDHLGILDLAKSLVLRAEEGKAGVCAFGDIGSFFMFDRLTELLQYELSLPSRLGIKLKAFCSYHQRDFERLDAEQRQVLTDHLHRRIMPQN